MLSHQSSSAGRAVSPGPAPAQGRATDVPRAGTAASATGGAGRPILVYFPRHPETDADFTAVFPVQRQASDEGVAATALRALIAGPTPAEAADGYFSELGDMLSGPSTCGGPDFTLRLEDGTATVRFCRAVSSAGVGQDARVQGSIEATLRQFPTIQRVRVLGPEGSCLFDLSGEDRCLHGP